MSHGIICQLNYSGKEVYVELVNDFNSGKVIVKVLDSAGGVVKQMKQTWDDLPGAIKGIEKFGKVKVLGTRNDVFGIEDNINQMPD